MSIAPFGSNAAAELDAQSYLSRACPLSPEVMGILADDCCERSPMPSISWIMWSGSARLRLFSIRDG